MGIPALRRPTNLWADSVLLHKTVYGETAPTPELNNLRARPIRQFDGAGLTRALEFDFKGNLLQTQRQLATVYDATVDWTALASLTTLSSIEAAASTALEPEPFTETRQYDALNRITSVVSPDASQFVPSYNEAGLLESVQVHIRGATTPTPFVTNIDYNEKGQRTAIAYGNGTATAYQYDPLTFRLIRLTTSRTTPSATLQDLAYTLDPVGNIVQITDTAQQAIFFNNAVVLPENRYVYDALYRLTEANGREHHSLGDVQFDDADCPIETLPHANDATALRNYAETYRYDKVGNILELFHDAEGTPHATWRRRYDYGPFTDGVADTNRLRSTSLPGDTPGAVPYSAQYTHDVRGNMTSMPHLSAGIDWNALDQMVHASNGTQDTYFVYAADGTRVRKVFDTNSNLIKERVYLGAFELYRERVSGTIQEERQTLHIMDGLKRLAMVETKTVDAGAAVGSPLPMQRYQLGNHLGSAMLELDETGLVISYEEYHPYGSSAYRSARSGVEVSARRYRYVGMERDDETGLYHMGARYYCAWLGRWTSADPMGIGADGPGVYNYTRGSPVTMSDPSGHQGAPPTEFHEDHNVPQPPGFERGHAEGPNRPLRKAVPRPLIEPKKGATKSEKPTAAPKPEEKGGVPKELLDLADKGKLTFDPKLLPGVTDEQKQHAVALFLHTAAALGEHNYPQANAVLVAGTSNSENSYGKSGPNPNDNNWLSFQPNPSQERELLKHGIRSPREKRDNGPGNPTSTPSPKFHSVDEGIKYFLELVYAIKLPKGVIAEAEEVGKALKNPNLTIRQFVASEVVSGTFGRLPSREDPQKRTAEIERRVQGRTPPLKDTRDIVVSWLTHLPTNVSKETRTWAANMAKDHRQK